MKRTEGNFARRKNDEYDTPDKGIAPLLPYLGPSCRYVEPCAGKGNIVNFLKKHGHECVGAYDINPRAEGIDKMDMFDTFDNRKLFNDAEFIITNPPWTRKLLHPMIEMWQKIKPTWLLFDGDWAFTKQASPYLLNCKKIVAIPRLKWIEGSPHSSKDNCAWYLFDENHNGGPTEFIGRKY